MLIAWPSGKISYGVDPSQPRRAPALRLGSELVSLVYRPQANAYLVSIFKLSGRVDRRPTIRAKVLKPATAIIAEFHVEFRLSTCDLKCLASRRHGDPISRPGQSLAVCAVADRHLLGVDFRLVRNKPTMTSSIYVHRLPAFALRTPLKKSRAASGRFPSNGIAFDILHRQDAALLHCQVAT